MGPRWFGCTIQTNISSTFSLAYLQVLYPWIYSITYQNDLKKIFQKCFRDQNLNLPHPRNSTESMEIKRDASIHKCSFPLFHKSSVCCHYSLFEDCSFCVLFICSLCCRSPLFFPQESGIENFSKLFILNVTL